MQLSENEQKVLKLLQTNSRLSAAEISRQLDISRTTVNVILGRLEEQVIDSYSLTLKRDLLDTRINCYVLLKADPKVLTVDDELIAISEIRSLKSVAGSVDMVAQLQCDNHQHLDDILLKIARLEGITDTETLVMLKDKVSR